MLAQLTRIKLIAIGALLLLPVSLAQAADHMESPSLIGSVDINDLFLFRATDANKSVMILTVNPFAGSDSGTTFNSDASYQFKFDNNGDSVTDITYSTTFAPQAADGRQSYSVNRTDSGGTTTIANGVTGTASATNNGGLVQAGNFDDPFISNSPADVSAIVLELPNADFFGGSSSVGAHAITTLLGVPQDRMAIPGIATALIAIDRRDAYNAGDPVDDLANFGAELNAAIAQLSNQANADNVTPILLPDLLTYDASEAGGYFNGRRLDDDPINSTLLLFSEGVIPGETGGSGGPFRDGFPYLFRLNAVLELGDVNLDGTINFDDIPAFITVLIDGEFQPEADSDQSGVVDFADIPAFIDILVGS